MVGKTLFSQLFQLNISKVLALCWAKFLFSTVVSPVTFTVYVKWDKQVNVTKDTSSCFISQMFGKLEFRKSENAFICQIAIFTLFHHLNFSYILEMKQTDMP